MFEQYINKDNPANLISDTVPSTTGSLTIISEFSAATTSIVELSQVNTIDTLKSLVFTMPITGVPNFLEDLSVPDYSYTNKLEIIVETPSGNLIPWLPVENPVTHEMEPYRGYLLGYVSEGNKFATNGPEAVDFILRDPPGSGSSATRETGSTSSSTNSWNQSESYQSGSKITAYVGAKFSAGIGVQVESEISLDASVGIKSEYAYNSSGSVSSTNTTTSEISTNSDVNLPGAESDLFFGKSQNVEFGIVRELTIFRDIDCQSETCYGNSVNGFQVGEQNSISIEDDGYDTYFVYDQNHIKNYLIPSLKEKIKATLQSNPLYSSFLGLNDINYGKNNDDPDFGSLASSETSDVRELEFDNTGVSYMYSPVTTEDSLQDIVWTDNYQINLWEKALAENEWEKIHVDNPIALAELENNELESLYAEYEKIIDRYNTLNTTENAAQDATFIAALYPGWEGTAAGVISFAVTKHSAIDASKITNLYNEYLAKKERVISNFDREKSNYSISGGTEVTFSESHERVISTNNTFNYDMTTSLSNEIKAKVNGNGLGLQQQLNFGFKKGRSETAVNASTETTAFTFYDADEGDYFSVDVYPSLLGYGPIFKLKEGGQTSCPYEGEIVTEYYEPGTVISGKTQQRDRPVISINPSIVQNVPMDGSAVFTVSLGNTSVSHDAREYSYQLVSNSNPHGAIVKVDGLSPQGTIAINANASLNKTITVQKGAGPVFEYDSLLFIISATCQYESGTGANDDIADSVYFSAHFIPGCTDVTLIEPNNQWVVNNSFNNIMPVIVGDYDINFSGLEQFRIDYKPSNEANWIGLQSYYKDTTGLNDENTLEIPTSSHFTFYDWDVKQLTDGNYDLRVVSLCEQATDGSEIFSGIIDRVNPHSFGKPSPADGILDANDDISVTFNEEIESGSLSALNFDIRGVLNGSDINHNVSAEFTGDSCKIEIPSGLSLQKRDFTIEFWAKNATYNDVVFISQGPGNEESLTIGAQSDGKIYFEIDNERITTNGNVANSTQWHHYAFAYNFENETVHIYIDDALANIYNIDMYKDYIGSGKLLIGQSYLDSLGHFEGKMHDLRIWNHTRTQSQIISHMNVQVGKQDVGLLHNWAMNEGEGQLVTDHVRLRNGLLTDIGWSLEPGGYSYAFNANDSTPYTLSAANIVFTNEMDFTLEFWSNGSSTNRETLFSNGKGDGLEADSLTSWSITKFTDGSLHLLHHGEDIVIADSTHFNEDWHHVAIVVDRSSIVSTYLDGNLTSTTQPGLFKSFAAAQFNLGSRYFNNQFVKEYDEFFTGNIDEFRIWNLARSHEQINRDMHYKLSGDEFGLKSYIPFEKYEEELGVLVLKENYTDQVDTSHHESFLEQSHSNYTPSIKLPRSIKKVNYTYSINGDKIIITPTNPKWQIENVTLDVTVKDVFDIHGNKLQSPITWIAFPDQNQVVWETELVDIDIFKDDGYIFTKKIINSGGAAKNFTIENMPSWLTSDISEGVVDAGSSVEVEFTVDTDINIGNYKEDLLVLTDFGYPERLTIDLKVRGVEPEWDVNPQEFEHSMSVVGSILINDVVSIDEEDILYAFVNNECRGKAYLQYISSTDQYLAFLDVFSNQSTSDSIEFRIWDASSGSKFVEVTPNHLTFAANDLVGSIINPQQFEAFSKIHEEYVLEKGWNWISFHLATEDTAHLELLLESIQVTDSTQIKTSGNNTIASYSEMTGWVGNLYSIGVSLEKGYKIFMTRKDTLVVTGDVVDPIGYNIGINSGWSWIGFISIRPLSTNLALGNLSATSGDLIKGKTNFALYDEQLGWIGSLNTMYPGQAYMYNSLNPESTSFTYPKSGGFKMMNTPEFKILEDSRWPVNYSKSVSNMSVVVELEACEHLPHLDEWYIGFFDGTGTCRALSVIEKVNDEKQIAFVTAVGKNELELKPKLLNKTTGEALELNGTLDYMANTLKGSYETPLLVSLKQEDCAKFVLPQVIEEIIIEHDILVYPNIFDHAFTIEYSASKNESLSLELINNLGQKVLSLEEIVLIGENKFEVNHHLSDLPKGHYVLKISGTNHTEQFKLVKN